MFDQASIKEKESYPAVLADLLNSVAKNEATYNFSRYEDLLFVINGDKTKVIDRKNKYDIADFDFVYQRRWGAAAESALASTTYLKKKKVPFIDSELDRAGASGKLSQMLKLWQANIPTAETIVLPEGKFSEAWLQATLDELNISAPFIVKSISASRGRDNHLARNLKDIQRIVKKKPDTRFMIQRFIPNDGDYRAIVGKKRILLTIKRVAAPGSHRNNTSQGGSATVVDSAAFSKKVKSDIIKAAKAFKRDLAGVDVIFEKGTHRHYILEVNRGPQIEKSSFEELKAKAAHKFFMGMTK